MADYIPVPVPAQPYIRSNPASGTAIPAVAEYASMAADYEAANTPASSGSISLLVTDFSASASNLTYVEIGDAPLVTTVDFPELLTVETSCYVYSCLNVASFSFPQLETVSVDLGIDACPSVSTLSFPELVLVGGNLSLQGNDELTDVSFPVLETTNSTLIISCPLLSLISFPALVDGGILTIQDNDELTGVSFPVLETASLTFFNCPLLVSLSFPALTTLGGTSIQLANLTSVAFPAFVPTNGSSYSFQQCALSAASVNHILARCVANAGFVSGAVLLNAGTSAAPTGQGIVDAAALTGRGVTVITNP